MAKSFSEVQKKYRKRILEISYKHKLSHLGSCLSVVDLIIAIYDVKLSDDKFILSGGHGGVALYSVLEKYHLINAEKLFKKHGIHPNRDLDNGIYCSTGSLGQGFPIALGMAISDRGKNVYCIITDGECTEGSVWEALRIASENKLTNLKIVINANGYGAYGEINIEDLAKRIMAFGWKVVFADGHDIASLKRFLRKESKRSPLAIIARTRVDQLPFLSGIDAHYKLMSEEDYQISMKVFE